MNKSIKITNIEGQSVTFGSSGSYILLSFDPSGTQADLATTKGYQQDGITVHEVTLREKQVPLQFCIEGESIEDVYQKRRELNNIMNPKLGPFTLRYTFPIGEREITFSLESFPKFQVDDEKYVVVMRGILYLLITDPYWYNPEQVITSLTSWTPTFIFPFDIALDFYFSQKGEQKQVFNDGDEDAPIIIDIYGPVTNPTITNTTTGEFIRLKRTIQAGQHVQITTAYGKKTVSIISSDGTITNVLNWLDWAAGSKFFKLKRGLNILDYSADADRDSAEIIISMYPQYAGI